MFLKKDGFPYVVGCINGSINAPSINEEQFIDRHDNYSIKVTMICSPNRLFYAKNANWPGSVYDVRVLRNTNVFVQLRMDGDYFPGLCF